MIKIKVMINKKIKLGEFYTILTKEILLTKACTVFEEINAKSVSRGRQFNPSFSDKNAEMTIDIEQLNDQPGQVIQLSLLRGCAFAIKLIEKEQAKKKQDKPVSVSDQLLPVSGAPKNALPNLGGNKRDQENYRKRKRADESRYASLGSSLADKYPITTIDEELVDSKAYGAEGMGEDANTSEGYCESRDTPSGDLFKRHKQSVFDQGKREGGCESSQANHGILKEP